MLVTDQFIPALDALQLSLLAFFLELSLLPLLVGDARHDFLVRGGFALPFFHLSLLLVSVALLYVLVSLLEQTLFEPILEYLICGFLLNLLLEPFVFELSVMLDFLLLIFLALALLPLHHGSLLLLFTDTILSLVLANLLQDVSLSLLDKLFLQLDLMLLSSHPFFVRDGVG